MCGIAGILNTNGRPAANSDVQAMIDRLVHRGPDGEGIWQDGPICLGHRRLAIRDLSKDGHQPMSDVSSRIYVSYNGEIYNELQLREEISEAIGYEFHTKCDTEIIPAGYLAWGEGIFQRLEGMFAIALWDSEAQKLILARDGVGIKPLYLSRFDQTVRFGSEIKALLALADQPRTLSPEALHSFLAQGYVSPSKSLIASIDQVTPGTYQVFEGNDHRVETFWRPERSPTKTHMGSALTQLGEIFPNVTKDMLVGDVPVAVLQSGGIDSTLISYSLKEQRNITAYTAQFEAADHNESIMAAAIAHDCGFKHKITPVDTTDDAAHIFRKMVYHLDGQLADSSAFAVYQLMEAVGNNCKVVMSGDGADEFFGGYPTYRATRLAKMIRPLLPTAIWRALGKRFICSPDSGGKRNSIFQTIGRFAYGLSMKKNSQHPEWRRLLPEHLIPKLYGPKMMGVMHTNPLKSYVQALNGANGSSLVDRAMVADQSFYLPSDMLMKVDAMSMAHSVEVRVPFLDRRIMEFAGNLDADLLTPMAGPDKKILRLLLSELGAAKTVFTHPKKGFNIPIAHLLRNDLAELCEKYLIKEADRFNPYFQPQAISNLWIDFINHRADYSYSLWTFLVLGIWLEQLSS